MAGVGECKVRHEQQLALEEKLREAACIGDLDTVKVLVGKGHAVDVNSKNSVNGWLVCTPEVTVGLDLGITPMLRTECSKYWPYVSPLPMSSTIRCLCMRSRISVVPVNCTNK